MESDVYTHIAASTPISVTGGEYAISTDGGITWGGWTSLPGNDQPNDKVKVRQTSSATAGTATTATLAIPTAWGSGTFRVTTAGTNPVDTVPNAFAFTSLTIAPASTVTESSVVTVSGINAPSPISVTGGQYAISTDGGLSWGAWTNLAGTVADTNQVKVRLTSSATPGASASATLTIGGVIGCVLRDHRHPGHTFGLLQQRHQRPGQHLRFRHALLCHLQPDCGQRRLHHQHSRRHHTAVLGLHGRRV